ncbi:probable cytochrome P450 312a1 [Trichonephila clavata]|uniref:Probable cytochrome P450 312a1 n=1 Tax=Trichonephila clavata TaxID=2740835 RepID=A0A8X6KVR0_TRICU|nr:probable cytochrome P450 312a1 [Trichonephila clavata]
MKQDLKRQDLRNVFLGNASTSKKSSAVSDHVDAASGYVSGNKWYQKDEVKELLKNPKMCEKSPLYEALEFMIGRGIITSPVEKWKPRRKSLNPCFHHDMLKRYLEVFNAYSQTLVNILKIETEKEFCDIRKPLAGVTLDIICETMLGFSVGAVNDPESQYIKAFERLTDIGTKRVFTFWLWPDTIFRFTSYYREAYQSIKLFNDLARSVSLFIFIQYGNCSN